MLCNIPQCGSALNAMCQCVSYPLYFNGAAQSEQQHEIMPENTTQSRNKSISLTQ